MARDGDGIYLRNGIFCFRYRDAQTGQWREKSTGKSKKSEAWREKDRFLTQLQDGTLPTDMANWALKKASDHWLEVRKATKDQKTWSCDRSLIKKVIAFFGENRLLKTLAWHDLEAYQARRRKAVGPRTVNLELRCLRQVLQRAGLWSRFDKHYKALKEPKTQVGQAMSQEDLSHFVSMANSRPDWEVAFHCSALAQSTGLRGFEIKRLQIGCVDLKTRVLQVRSSKTDAGIREVPLNNIALWAATRLVRRACLLGAKSNKDYLLPIDHSKRTRKGHPQLGLKGYDFSDHQRSWSSAWRSLRKKAGISTFRFHDWRHSFITAGAEADVPIEVMISIVGHISPEMTRKYTHIRSKAQENAVKAIETESKTAFASVMLQV